MGYWLDVILCCGVVGIEIVGVIATLMLVQGITYWTTGYSIFNNLLKKIK